MVTAEYVVVHEGADLAYTVGYETGDVLLDGAPMTRQRLRVTQIYRREDGSGASSTATAISPHLTRARHDRHGTEHGTLRVRRIAKRECSPVAQAGPGHLLRRPKTGPARNPRVVD